MTVHLADVDRPTVGALMSPERRAEQIERIDRRLAGMKAKRSAMRFLERVGRPVLRLVRGGRP